MTKKTLSQILALDAATCMAVFALGVFATGTLASLTGLPDAIVVYGGWICLAAAALLVWLAAHPTRGLLWLAILGNAAWVAASLAVWAVHAGELTALGHAVVLGQAAGVGLFVALEIRGAAGLARRQALA